jgi:3'-5' exoribonuclease
MEPKGPMMIQEIRSSTAGEQVWGKFLILELQRRRTRDGKLVVNLKLGDQTGSIDGVIWEGEQVTEEYSAGKVVGVVGDAGQYNNKPQLILRRYKLVDEAQGDYLPAAQVDVEQMMRRLEERIASLQDRYMKRLAEDIFTAERKQLFQQMPGGRTIHHGYRGGLLEHTLSVVQLCELLSQHYPKINRDLLVTGALLHDIGKLEEYKMVLTPEYTAAGRLLGHIAMGAELVGGTIEAIKADMGFPTELSWMIRHMILSHHGALEFGSPVLPQFPEAFALHLADNLDAKLFVFFQRAEDDAGDDPYFSGYDGIFHQQFFKYRYPGEEGDSGDTPQ